MAILALPIGALAGSSLARALAWPDDAGAVMGLLAAALLSRLAGRSLERAHRSRSPTESTTPCPR
jgi:hypothetical protein